MALSLWRTAAAAVALICTSLSGCVSPVAGSHGLYAPTMGSAPVTANPTPYSQALACLGDYARSHGLTSPRIAVGRISDYTGKDETDGGRKLTQGASLMAISALAKTGARIVERYDTSVSELELKYANNKLIGDRPTGDKPVGDKRVGEMSAPGKTDAWRHIEAGQVAGSDFYLVGGITEFNYNIRTAGATLAGAGSSPNGATGGVGGQLYVMNVGLDLRLVDTRSLEVVDVVSYQKQIIARQVSVGFFKIIGSASVDADVGESGLEPIQLAVRSVIERAVLDLMARRYGAPGARVCLDARRDALAGEPAPAGDDRRGRW